MAGDSSHSAPQNGDGDAPKTSFEDHKQTFDAFLGLIKWGVAVVAILLIGMAVFLI